MDWVAKMSKLESLSLEYTAVSDAGFAKLAGLTQLHGTAPRSRRTSRTLPIKVLSGMSKLHYMDLYHTEFSEQGYESLKKALPACDINWNKDSTQAGAENLRNQMNVFSRLLRSRCIAAV